MLRSISKIARSALLMGMLVFAGCTQMPTEKQSISDMRPQIAFKIESSSAKNARVLVDNLDMGTASDFVEGKSALRVLSGTHLLNVVKDGQVLLSEKIYLGDGVSRSFVLK